jgi:hypothetical protein
MKLPWTTPIVFMNAHEVHLMSPNKCAATCDSNRSFQQDDCILCNVLAPAVHVPFMMRIKYIRWEMILSTTCTYNHEFINLSNATWLQVSKLTARRLRFLQCTYPKPPRSQRHLIGRYDISIHRPKTSRKAHRQFVSHSWCVLSMSWILSSSSIHIIYTLYHNDMYASAEYMLLIPRSRG